MTHAKNIAASTKARLQNVAAKRDENFNQLLTRYGFVRLPQPNLDSNDIGINISFPLE